MATLTEVESGWDDEQRIPIQRWTWAQYETLRKFLENRRSIRLTYDRGAGELIFTSSRRERYSYLLGRMVQTITEELDIPIACTSSSTLRLRDLDRGLEPDDSYYIANAHRVPNTDRIDLEVTPPPDLAIEVEITNCILDRLGVYASLGVPELWRFDGEKLTVLLLGDDGNYAESPSSRSFPFLPLEGLTRFLLDHVPGADTRWAKRFRVWVREVLLPLYQGEGGRD